MAVIVGPIYYLLPDYRFLWANLLFVFLFITLTRHIFLLRYSFLADWRNIKIALIFLCLWIAFLVVQEINAFQVFLDENGPEAIVGSLPDDDQQPMLSYIRSQFIFFGVGATIACAVLPIRLIISIYRKWNGIADY
ncbi:MAG: hypothetical protein D6772_07465 [Bacteroidetes bacterium]|nr:MAG: hypothetical protein D6772_07465 [Bacteroidota bacterium]